MVTYPVKRKTNQVEDYIRYASNLNKKRKRKRKKRNIVRYLVELFI